jgi:hypothetical protein
LIYPSLPKDLVLKDARVHPCATDAFMVLGITFKVVLSELEQLEYHASPESPSWERSVWAYLQKLGKLPTSSKAGDRWTDQICLWPSAGAGSWFPCSYLALRTAYFLKCHLCYPDSKSRSSLSASMPLYSLGSR